MNSKLCEVPHARASLCDNSPAALDMKAKGAPMEAYKQEFIDFMVESDVLKFGEFTLKSGRKSPFFMNAGAYVTGSQLKRLDKIIPGDE